MSNWCEGTLRVRGEKKNIKQFLLESFLCKNGEVQPLIIENENGLTIQDPPESYRYFKVKGSKRNIVESNKIEWNYNESVLVIENFMGKSYIETDVLIELSKEYQVDLEVYASENDGGGFIVDFEVHKGTVIKEEWIKFDCQEDHWNYLEILMFTKRLNLIGDYENMENIIEFIFENPWCITSVHMDEEPYFSAVIQPNHAWLQDEVENKLINLKDLETAFYMVVKEKSCLVTELLKMHKEGNINNEFMTKIEDLRLWLIKTHRVDLFVVDTILMITVVHALIRHASSFDKLKDYIIQEAKINFR